MSFGTKIQRNRILLTLDTATAVQERSDVPFDGARAHELISDQIGVVGGRDVVFGKRAGHVHPNRRFLTESRVLLGQEKRDKVLDLPCAVLADGKRRGRFGGGSRFRSRSNLFGCREDLDE
jgi:hypothetical protein